VEEIEGIRRQQTDLIASVMAGFATEASPTIAEAYAEIIVGACERLALWCQRRGDITPEQATDHVLDLVWSGLVSRIRA
ncbi:MAG TPA: TetR family transcriptional regulator, partial [Pseudonocardiaceae bacterium]|nr:TetR family transcriptional regulator [Pseudonocardiaceae bacterium]